MAKYQDVMAPEDIKYIGSEGGLIELERLVRLTCKYPYLRNIIRKKCNTKYNENYPLHIFIKRHIVDLDLVKILLECGANINISDVPGKRDRPLYIAAQSGNLELIKLLLDNGADINLKDEDGFNAVDYALGYIKMKAVKLLLEYESNINNFGIDARALNYIHNIALLNAKV